MFENNNDICNHRRNIKALLIEVFKMKNELVPPIMKSILNKRFKVYNLWLSGACDGKKKKKSFDMVLKKCLKEMKSVVNSKEILNIRYAVTDLAGYVKLIFKILCFYNVKSYS